MGSSLMTRGEVDFADVQGLVRFGYKRMTTGRFDLLRVRNAAAARQWLGSVEVTSAMAMSPPPKVALHVAFTAPGLRALEISESVIENFSHEFRTGMTTEYRARQLGDVGANAPERWRWGGPGKEPHLLVMFMAEPGDLEMHVQRSTVGWDEAFERPTTLDIGDLGGFEPFGFRDGISQPKIDWKQRREVRQTELSYTNVSALGEFLLGYPNEYRKFTERPLLDPDTRSAGLPPALDAPQKRDLGRNGTYLVIRQLEQDVRKFWQFVDRQAGGDFAEADGLAATMVGRTRGGDPLMAGRVEPAPGLEPGPRRSGQNEFTFEDDVDGTRCPFGAHVRRANPRNADFPERPRNLLKKLAIALGFGPKDFQYDVMSPVRFHRVLRRGRPYGPKLRPEDALAAAAPNEPERGLYFVCLNANISRQFEFVQNAWMVSTKFAALTGESDPLVGNREPIPGCPVTSDFNIPRQQGLRKRVSGLPQFVTVRGGAYFFLPSLSALRYLAADKAT